MHYGRPQKPAVTELRSVFQSTEITTNNTQIEILIVCTVNNSDQYVTDFQPKDPNQMEDDFR